MMNKIEKQYRTSKNLSTRKSIHDKYSVNPQPFQDWIYAHYEISSGDRILELGCGTAEMWKGKEQTLPKGVRLTLTDFSAGMLSCAKANTSELENVTCQVVDIQAIPFPDDSFDLVIANMMLYHVPDLHRGLREVRRVLKPGGTFCCATYGEHGIMEFVNDSLRELGIRGEIGRTFTLQNGATILAGHFEDVHMDTREDGLAIRRVDDFADYVLSMSGLMGADGIDRSVLTAEFEKKTQNGILYVPKEYGMFICK